MTEQLHPDQHQQEQRAAGAKDLADQISSALSTNSAEVTLKGEAIDVNLDTGRIVITANGDSTFSIKEGPSHVSSADVLNFVKAAA